MTGPLSVRTRPARREQTRIGDFMEIVNEKNKQEKKRNGNLLTFLLGTLSGTRTAPGLDFLKYTA